MADETTPAPAKRPLPHQQVSPAWYLQNLALLGVGTGLGYGAGATAAHFALAHGVPGFLGRMDPAHRNAFFRGAGALAGAGSAFALSQARSAMEERLHRKREEREQAAAPPQQQEAKAASLRSAMGLR